VGLYVLEVSSPWGCSFWTSGLAYNTDILSRIRLIAVQGSST